MQILRAHQFGISWFDHPTINQQKQMESLPPACAGFLDSQYEVIRSSETSVFLRTLRC
jgi:hypothetical protein